MKKFLIIIFIFLFYFNKPVLAIDFGSYLAGESALINKDNQSAIYHFKNAINSKELKTEYGIDIAKKLCNLYLLEGEIDDCVLLGKKIENQINSEDFDSANILMALVVSDIKEKKINSALTRLKKIQKSSYERFSKLLTMLQ